LRVIRRVWLQNCSEKGNGSVGYFFGLLDL
jgi:hypothetical protein